MTDTLPHDRAALRRELLARRRDWLGAPAAHAAHTAVIALEHSLRDLLAQLEPQCLGLYWPLEGEFNAGAVAMALPCELALPFARKNPQEMRYRRWDGKTPGVRDECGIPASAGAECVPDLVLVPCVGFTREGYRLGYGGGYFDRWIAAHPGVTSVGLAWSVSEAAFAVEPHDAPLSLVLTEREVIVA